jgi:ElaB/YqjD/DUF883 family membrane-anchored ribosome-binding protein
MVEGNGAAKELSQEKFKSSFGALQQAILGEWPVIDKDALLETAGNLEKVIDLVAETTDHTRTLVRKQIAELSEMDTPKFLSRDKAAEMLDRLNKRTSELVKELREKHVETAKTTMRENIFVTLFAALGIGLILGLIFGGFRRGRD